MLKRTPATTPINPGFDERPHAIVIGSGFGGLAAAVRLGARGYRVTVLERLEQAGGRANVFRQDGFTFDAGPTIITLPFLFEELWALCGRKLSDDVDMVPLKDFYTINYADGSTFTCVQDHDAMHAELARLNPSDARHYDRFKEESRKIYQFAFEGLGQIHFSNVWPMLKALPGFIRHRAETSVYQYVSNFFKDERLRFAFSFHPLFIGGNPFQSTSLYALVAYLEGKWGVHFAMGGTGSLVQGLVGLIKGQGGSVRLNAGVSQIVVEDGVATGVRLETGETLGASIVVSNVDAPTTYGKLLASHPRKTWTDRRIARTRYSMGVFMWYFGTDRRYDDVPHHSIILSPRYKGLIEDIFTRKVLADDFSLYLYRPTATDPSMAPDGCDSFYVLAPVPNLDGDTDWETTAESFRQRVEQHLSETLLPDLKAHVVTSKVMTPNDYRDRYQSEKGAAFSIEPVMLQSAWFRPHNRSEEVDNLFLVGAGTHPGAGVPGVISSARILDQVVPEAAVFAHG
jgi:phytoene desaturase